MRYLLCLILAACAVHASDDADVETAARLERLEARLAQLEAENARLKRQVDAQGVAIVQIMDENPALARRIAAKMAEQGQIQKPAAASLPPEAPAPKAKDLSMKPALDKLRQDANLGDRKAAEKLDYLAKNPAYARMLFGDAWDQ